MKSNRSHEASTSIRLFDSHCHLDDRAFDKDLNDIIHRIHDVGVASVMTISTTLGRYLKKDHLPISFS
jgi:Tat protein secretion system quality control protein TatD with DNase activity